MSAKTYKRILVVTDGLKSSEPVHETALNLAKKHGAEILLVDTLQEPSAISKWFTANANDVFEMVLADKQVRLGKFAEEFNGQGIKTESKVLLGQSSTAITREAIAWDACLVIRYMKGAYSKYPGLFGGTARSLMQFCPSPLLLVGSEPISNPKVLACIDTDQSNKENNSILSESASLVDDKSQLSGLFCWEMYGRDLIEKRMNADSFKETLEHTKDVFAKSLDEFMAEHDVSMFGGGIRMENGEPSLIIPRFCQDQSIDVVVMCSASLNHPLRRYFGTTVESVVEKLTCSLMVVKPIGFVSPLAESDSAKA